MLRLRVVIAASALVLGACSFITTFDPEGQPCDLAAPPELQCLSDAGYWCVGGLCSKLGSPPDAGPFDAGSARDAGRPDAGRPDSGAADAGGTDGGGADGGDGGAGGDR